MRIWQKQVRKTARNRIWDAPNFWRLRHNVARPVSGKRLGVMPRWLCGGVFIGVSARSLCIRTADNHA
jgi:hypothetical protein